MAQTNCRCPFYRGVHPIEVSVQSDSNVFETVLTQCMLVGGYIHMLFYEGNATKN